MTSAQSPTVSTPLAAFDHPVLRILSGIVRQVDDRYELDDDGADLLAYALTKHGDDPELPQALLTLMAVAVSWGKTPHQAAGVRILEVVAAVRPQLEVLEQSRASTRATRKLLDQPIASAPTVDASQNSGSLARFRARQDRRTRKRTHR